MNLRQRQALWRKKVVIGAGLASLVFALMALVPTPWYNAAMCAFIAAEWLVYAIIECITCKSMEANGL
jgi:hypothetical protein